MTAFKKAKAEGRCLGVERRPDISPENVYGHRKRLEWIRAQLSRSGRVVEVGCGTGHMITRPLARMGHDVVGIDVHEPSIRFGQELLRRDGLDPGRLLVGTLDRVPGPLGAVILSEVLEHLRAPEIGETLDAAHRALAENGVLLVTVPNGYGWFEGESLLWHRLGVGRALEATRLPQLLDSAKRRLLGEGRFDHTPSTLDTSPHVRRFTARSLCSLLGRHGFRVVGLTGSVLVSGPFSSLLFGGLPGPMALNARLGDLCPRLASGFFAAGVREAR